ncbi:MAG: hypothetical protein IKU11_04785 [Clostridia bacterium]|nr:hypothetical protein [Clostridia bacterium]
MNFRIKHLIFPVRKVVKLVIEPIFPLRVDPKECYSIRFLPFSGLRKYGLRNSGYIPTAADEAFFAEEHPLSPEGDFLTLSVTFPQEDCYICRLYVGDTQVETHEIYALEEDLFAKNPYKGDNHLHTRFSDGKDSPMYMAAAACRFGYDYCVITDHYRYAPSLMARDFFAPTGIDFLVVPGEEVHSPDNPVHIINWGGRESVNAWFQQNEAEYRAAVEAELSAITEPMTDADRYAAAACQVIFDRIRQAGGLSILCHPHWIVTHGFNEHEDITDYLADHKRFDVLELIAGGAYEVGTQIQLSYYKARPAMPIVGSSDSHGCFGDALEPGNFTIAFADSLEVEAIKSAIGSGLAIAGNDNKFYGDYRLVKYAYFLQRNYYPEHKKKRNALGAWMVRMASSNGETDTPDDKRKAIRPSEDFTKLRYTE